MSTSEPLHFKLPFTHYAELGYLPVPCEGKVPVGGKGWNTRVYDYEALDRTKCNVGLLCSNIVGLDIDIEDAELADRIEMLCRKVLKLPVDSPRRIGKAPKRLLIVRVSEPVGGWDIMQKLEGGKGRTLFQLLGDGKQFIIHGTHPDTRRPYTLDQPLPAWSELPEVSFDQLIELRIAIGDGLIEQGLTITGTKGGLAPTQGAGAFSHTRWANDAEVDRVIEALASISPELPRLEWLRVACALHDGTHGDADGFDMFHAWSSGELRGYPVPSPKYKGERDCWRLWNGLKPGKGVTTGTLFSMAAAGEWSNAVGEASTPETLGVVLEDDSSWWLDWAQLVADEPEDVSWIIPGWLPGGCVTLYNGDGGSGKSFCSLEIAVRLALGAPVFGKQTARMKVAFLSGEDDVRTLYNRAKKIAQKIGHTPIDLNGWLFLRDASADESVLFSEAQGEANGRKTGIVDYWTARFDLVAQHWESSGAQLLILDNSSDVYDANENDRAKVKQFLSGLNRLLSFDTAILLLAHVNAETAKLGGDGKGYSGSTAWNNGVRSRWFQWRKDGEIFLQLKKSNYAPPGLTVEIAWDGATATFTIGEEIALDHNPSQHAGLVLRLINEFAEAETAICPSKAARNNVFKILKAHPDYPKSLGSSSLFELQDSLVVGGFLLVQSVKNTRSGKTAQQLALTPKGRLEMLD